MSNRFVILSIPPKIGSQMFMGAALINSQKVDTMLTCIN